ncbi:MAG: hypothetical protein AB7G06_05990 [Bdellovibrionales bacterium]
MTGKRSPKTIRFSEEVAQRLNADARTEYTVSSVISEDMMLFLDRMPAFVVTTPLMISTAKAVKECQVTGVLDDYRLAHRLLTRCMPEKTPVRSPFVQ